LSSPDDGRVWKTVKRTFSKSDIAACPSFGPAARHLPVEHLDPSDEMTENIRVRHETHLAEIQYKLTACIVWIGEHLLEAMEVVSV